jgi:ABC-type glycerol-3-phosphate transport system substrate-binding protein
MQPKCTIRTAIFSVVCLVSAISVILTGFAGCSQPPPPPPPTKPFPGVTIRVSAPSVPAIRDMLERHGRTWADRSGGQVQLVAADAGADVRVFAPHDLGRLVSRGELAPLSLAPIKGQDAFEFSQILRHEVERNMDWGGKTYAMPLLGESIVCVYRSDLLEDAKHKTALNKLFQEKLRHPRRSVGLATWQEFALIAEYFAAQSGWAAGAPVPNQSLPPLPASAGDLERDFHLVAAPFVREAINLEKSSTLTNDEKTNLLFSYQFDADTGEPLIGRPGFVAALKLMQRLQACRLPGTSAQPIDAFRAGNAVLAVATLADVARLQEPGSPVRDKFAACRIPGSDSIYDVAAKKFVPAHGNDGNVMPFHGHGGWMGGLATGGAEVAAATDLLLFMASPKISQEIVCEPAWGGGPTRMSHLNNRAGWHNYGLSSANTVQLIAVLDSYYSSTLLNPTYCLRVSDRDGYVKAFAQRVTAGLQQNQPADAVMKDVAQAWRDLGKSKDKATHLRDYRMSQGLR